MKTNLFDQNGSTIWEIELNESVFWLDLNEGLIHRALVYQLANNRMVVAHTKQEVKEEVQLEKSINKKVQVEQELVLLDLLLEEKVVLHSVLEILLTLHFLWIRKKEGKHYFVRYLQNLQTNN